MEARARGVGRGMTRSWALLLCCLGCLPPALARADAIEGPPACPRGARRRSSHAGQWCEVASCASDADCADGGGHCRAYRVCTRHASIPPGGRGAFRDPPPPPFEVDLVVGSCEPSAACRGDEEPPPISAGSYTEPTPTCREARVCVADALPSLPFLGAPAPVPTSPAGAPTPSPGAGVSVSREVHASCGCAATGRGAGAALPLALSIALALGTASRRRR